MPPDEARYLLMEALHYHQWGWYYEANRLLELVAQGIKDEEAQE